MVVRSAPLDRAAQGAGGGPEPSASDGPGHNDHPPAVYGLQAVRDLLHERFDFGESPLQAIGYPGQRDFHRRQVRSSIGMSLNSAGVNILPMNESGA